MKSNRIFLYICVILVCILCIRTAVAYSFFGGADEDFAALTSPTADDLRQVSDPSEEDFQHLLQTNQQEAAMYLMGETYSAEFAEMYIQQYGLSQGTAQEKGLQKNFSQKTLIKSSNIVMHLPLIYPQKGFH